MKTKIKLIVICQLLLRIWFSADAQGTAFTYQGQLQNNGSPASGTYNLTFTLFTTNIRAVAIAVPVTNNAVFVTNGLFTVQIDFGPGVFTGGTNWLQIGVETNGQPLHHADAAPAIDAGALRHLRAQCRKRRDGDDGGHGGQCGQRDLGHHGDNGQ